MAFRFETANERWSWYRGVDPSDDDALALGLGNPAEGRGDLTPGENNQRDSRIMWKLFEMGLSPRDVFEYFTGGGQKDEVVPLPRFDEIQSLYDAWKQDKLLSF